MSTTIDERVVEMRFDNKNFEQNAAQSISTLAKLKEKLHLKGAAKGLEAVNTASKRVDMAGLGNAVETVRTRFSALEVMGVTALANITNSAVNAGKRMVSALTVDPVMDGFREYEMTLNAVQTTMAGTGKTAKEVEEELKRLDVYADKTVYSTADMLNNLPKFTNAGVELEKATTAMIGIANATAHAGGDANKASIAFYNLGQAIGTGYLTRMDYNSINNAGIATMEWKKQMIEAAIAAGTLKKVGEDSYKAGKKTFTLQQLFIDGLQEQWATTDVMMDVFQDYGDETTAIGKKAYSSAQDIKTFSMMMDSLKATAGTGWKDTWQLIFGGLDDAKEFWTGLSNTISKVITKMADWRNNLIKGALDSPLGTAVKKIQKLTEATKEVTKVTEKFGDIVGKVIGGEFGNGSERIEKLTKAGYDWAHIQNLVNEKLGDSTRHATKFKDSQKELNKTQAMTIEQLMEMSTVELKNLGLSDKEISAFKNLKKYSEEAGIPIKDLVKDMDQLSGRNLLINSFKNIGKSIGQVFSAIGKAWRETFDAVDPEKIYSFIARFHKFTKGLVGDKDKMDKLVRTFKGLFAVLDIITTIMGGGFKLAFKVIKSVLGAFNIDILDATAYLGDLLVKFRDFLFDSDLIAKGFAGIATAVGLAVKGLKKLVDAVKNSEVAQNIIDGLKNGLKNGIKSIPETLANIGTAMLNAIKKILGIHSPSKEMEKVGKWSIEGLINGLKSGFGAVWDTLAGLGTKVVTWIKNFDWDKAFAIGAGVFILYLVKRVADGISAVTSVFQGVGDTLSGVGEVLEKSAKGIGKIMKNTAKVVKGFANVLNAKAWQMKAEALKDVAYAIAIVAGSVWVLSTIDYAKLWNAVGAIVVIAGILFALAYAMDKLTSASVEFDKKKGLNVQGIKTGMASLGIAVLAVALVVKLLGSMDADEAQNGLSRLAMIVLMIAGIFAIYGYVVKGKAAQNMDKAGKMMRKLATTMLVMVLVCKLAGKLSKDELIKGAIFAGGMLVFMAALMAITMIPAGKGLDKLGGLILKISFAMLLMIGVVKLASKLSWAEMGKGIVFAGGFALFVAALVAITKIGSDKQIAKVGGLLLAVSFSLLLMVAVCALVSRLSWASIGKGGAFIAGFIVMISLLIGVSKIGSEQQIAKVSGVVLAASLAIAIMAAVCIVLGLIDITILAKGVVAVAIFGALIYMMIKATKGAQNVKGAIIAMSVAIAVMAAAIGILSFIDPTKLIAPTIAMTMLMGMFALMTLAAKKLKGGVGPLLVLTAAVAVIAGVLYLLSGLPVNQVLGIAASISVLLISMSVSLALISTMGGMATSGIIALGAITLVVGLLGGLLYLLQGLNIEKTMGIVVALSTLVLAMSGACLILAAVGATGPAAIMGVMSLLALILAVGVLMVAIGALVDAFPSLETFLDKGIVLLEKIGNGIGSFVGGIVNGFGVAATKGLPQIGKNLSKFMEGAQPFIDGASKVDSNSLDGVMNLVAMIASLAGANLLETFASWISGESSMTKFGEQLREFADIIVDFSDKVRGKIDESSVMAAANAGKLMAEMQDSIPRTGGWWQEIAGEKDMGKFGDDISTFADAIIKFSDKVSGKISESAIQAAANAGKLLAEMQDSIPRTGGWWQEIAGEADMVKFSDDICSFGDAIVRFSDKVDGRIKESAIQAAANAGKIMIEMQNALPKTGGIGQLFTGEENLDKFANDIVTFGSAIVDFSSIVDGEISESAVKAAANAGMIMIEMQNALPDTGGVAQFFTGEKDMSGFADMMTKFGEGVVIFSDKVSSISMDSLNSSINAANRLVAFSKSVIDLDTSGISAFDNVVDIGATMKSFSDKVKGLSVDEVDVASSAARTLVTTTKQLVGIDTSGIANFTNITSIGDSMRNYSNAVNGIDTAHLTNSVTVANKLRDLLHNLKGTTGEGVDAFVSSIKELGTAELQGFIDAFQNAGQNLSLTGADMVASLVDGLMSGCTQLETTGNTLASKLTEHIPSKLMLLSAYCNMIMGNFVSRTTKEIDKLPDLITERITKTVTAITKTAGKFKKAGADLGSGLIIGIKSKCDAAYSAGYKLGQAAVKGEKDGQKSHSPSKLTIENGEYLGEGLVIGIESMMKTVYNKGYGLGKTATDSIASAIAKASDLLVNGINEAPTIRPVLDLSAVEAGVGTIGSLFGNGPAIGLSANIKAINAAMTKRQNGSYDDDLLDEMKGLRKDFASADTGTSITVNLSYDASSDANEIANDIAENLRRAVRRNG